MNIQRFKRAYVDLRLGFPLIAPVVAISNFVLIAYNLTVLKDSIPFELFTIIFAILFLMTVTVLGRAFRKKQLTTDFDIQFENKQNEIKIYKMILENQLRSLLPSDQHAREVQKMIDWLKTVEKR